MLIYFKTACRKTLVLATVWDRIGGGHTLRADHRVGFCSAKASWTWRILSLNRLYSSTLFLIYTPTVVIFHKYVKQQD